jgi:NTP pyrophosphatase (non-canonical NTP hydrolase)
MNKKPSPDQVERLAILSEECGEVVQAIGKILRWGWVAENKLTGKRYDNRAKLEEELGHILAGINLMTCDANSDLDVEKLNESSRAKCREYPEQTLYQENPNAG